MNPSAIEGSDRGRSAPSADVALPVRPSPLVGLATKVAFLCRPDAYPNGTVRVDAIETHMSWLFLTESRVYKLKKPVRHEYLDFSTLEARWEDCVAEVRLNRRLAPDTYLGVVPLSLGPGGLHLGGGGVPVDWLVEMRRLPAERFLDRALRSGTVTVEEVRHVASTLSRFYASARRIAMEPAEYRRRVEHDVLDDHRALCQPEFGLDPVLASGPAEALIDFIGHRGDLLEARASRLVEGHGDLRPEHVWLGDGDPVIIDCLEFRAEFRVIDPADELAFLGLECERLGAPWVGPELLRGFATGDDLPALIVDFYAVRRALLRAKLAVWHMRDGEVRTVVSWPKLATAYLELTATRCQRLHDASRCV